MNSDSEEAVYLPFDIGQAATQGDFERVKAWLAGGSASDPRSINARDHTDWTLLHWTVVCAGNDITPAHIEFARYLISQGVRVDAKSSEESTALHFACGSITGGSESTAAMVSMLLSAGATVHMGRRNGHTPLFSIYHFSEYTIDVVRILLRAGASLDFQHRLKGPQSFEEHLDHVIGLGLDDDDLDPDQHVGAIKDLVASVRAAGSWKAHCRLPHKQVLRLRSLVARGRVKHPRTRRTRGRDARQKRTLEFIVRQGDNGIVWNILSFWRETA